MSKPNFSRSSYICSCCNEHPADTKCSHAGCFDNVCRDVEIPKRLCGGSWERRKGCAITCEECDNDFCPTHAVQDSDGCWFCRGCMEAKQIMEAA